MSELKNAQDLIYLLSCAVNEETPDPERCAAMDIAEVFQTACRHSVAVAAATALEQVTALPPYFMEEKLKVIRVLSLYDVERVKILTALEARGVWYLPMKGIVLRQCYPKLSMRQMSDNDILCDSEKMAEVREVMEGFGYRCRSFDITNHDVYDKQPLLSFEMHRTLFPHNLHPQIYDYYQTIKEKLVRDEGRQYGYHMTDEDFYIFLICHLYKHYQLSGTGLRSLLDIYVFLKKRGAAMDAGYLDGELETLGLTEFERGTRRLAENVFTGKPLSDSDMTELGFIVASNTHGSFSNSMAHKLDNDDSGKSKRRYILKRVFPTNDYVRKKHPIIFRYKVLYPFWIIYRPFKGVLFKRRKLVSEIRGLKNFKKKEYRGKYHE